MKASRWLIVAVPICLSVLLTGTASGQTHDGRAAAGETQPPCAAPTTPTPVTPTTIGTIEQAYHCILDHYVDGSTLDHRVMLTGAFAAFTQELARRGLDQADATPPVLTGDRVRDWTAFGAVYQRVSTHLPTDPALRQALAAATLTGLVRSLHDNHLGWFYPLLPPGYLPGMAYGLGFNTAPFVGLAVDAPQEALPPLFVTTVIGGPAAQYGLLPGDVIEAVNGAPPFVDGTPSQGVMKLLTQQYPRADPVRLTLRRPATRRGWTVTLTPTMFQPSTAAFVTVTSTLLRGNIAEVRLTAFAPHVTDQVLQAIADLGRAAKLRGLILDLRGNGGGSPTEVARLLGAFTHGKTWSYDCDAADRCTANRTDDTVSPVKLPLVVLTDRNCVSACDAFADAVKDLRLGTLVGTRTGGIVSGAASPFVLNDNSLLSIPALHQKGANGEIINGIGVVPDHQIPLTAEDVSTGHDRHVERAITLLPR